MRFAIALLLAGAAALWSQDWRGWVAQGLASYQTANYAAAAEAFQKAVTLAPNEVEPRLHLGDAWLAQYIPWAPAPENLEFAKKAEREYLEVIRIEPENETAILSIASLKYQEAVGQHDGQGKLRMLDESEVWYKRAIGVNPQNKEAYYSLGVIGWMKWYPAWIAARAQLGMRPETAGPLTDQTAKAQLKLQYGALLDMAILNLNKALELDPMYDDAMAYMSLLIRERADLHNTPEQYASDIQTANHWVQRALDSKRVKAAEQRATAVSSTRRVRVDGRLQQMKLIRKVDPVHPSESGVRLQGTVRLDVIIGMDGHVQSLQLIGGDRLMAKAAMDAVRQWE